MLCSKVQQALESRYDLTTEVEVEDYVCHDQNLLWTLTNSQTERPEMLLFQEALDSLDVTLYLHPSVLENLSDTSPHNNANLLDDFCTLVEGVSHFVFLIWNVQHGRKIKLVDMELQAEVDKFVMTGSNLTAKPEDLTSRLFDKVAYFDDGIGGDQQRYQIANHFAAQYCTWLTSERRHDDSDWSIHSELARFYRLHGDHKFRYINSLKS